MWSRRIIFCNGCIVLVLYMMFQATTTHARQYITGSVAMWEKPCSRALVWIICHPLNSIQNAEGYVFRGSHEVFTAIEHHYTACLILIYGLGPFPWRFKLNHSPLIIQKADAAQNHGGSILIHNTCSLRPLAVHTNVRIDLFARFENHGQQEISCIYSSSNNIECKN
jgi:hypothetical protein